MTKLPIAALESMEDYQFLIDSPIPEHSGHVRSFRTIPASFNEVFASADIIVSKPGYATIMKPSRVKNR